MRDDLYEWLQTATLLAKHANKTMRQWADSDRRVEYKTDLSPVTQADTAINQMVIDTISERFPHHGVLGEEQSANEHTTGPLWVCDPIDGTIPFTIGVGVAAFSIAVVEDGRPVVAVCSDPWVDVTWSAVRGEGTFRNNQRVHVNQTTKMVDAYIGLTGTPNMFPPEHATALFHTLAPNCRKVLFLGSCVAEGVRVADGGFAASVFMNNAVVDVAATTLLVEEAGGKVTDLWGNNQRYDQPTRGALSSNGHLHDTLLEQIAHTCHQ